MTYSILQGDCLAVLKTLPDNSVDSVVTDPPYGISFMNKKWDHDVPSIDVWKECLRVLKPGGHMLVACGTRTQHRMVAPIEDAGFEIRDVITWLYGSGFPKSLNISKAIDKEAGHLRKSSYIPNNGNEVFGSGMGGGRWNAPSEPPATDAAKQWEGFGTAIKPAVEFWTLCRKPLSESTVAKNVLKHGTGGLNVDGCRVETADVVTNHSRSSVSAVSKGKYGDSSAQGTHQTDGQALGRFPSNLILDEEAAAALDEQSGTSAARFFYCAKSSKSDRGEGNVHPTCKPTSLMAYLCKLITPPGGLVLDPFAGSGSTGVGALREGFNFAGIEREAEYVTIIETRLAGIA